MADTPQFRDRSRAARRSGRVSGNWTPRRLYEGRLAGGPALASVVGSGALLAVVAIGGPTVAAPELLKFFEPEASAPAAGASAVAPKAQGTVPAYPSGATAQSFGKGGQAVDENTEALKLAPPAGPAQELAPDVVAGPADPVAASAVTPVSGPAGTGTATAPAPAPVSTPATEPAPEASAPAPTDAAAAPAPQPTEPAPVQPAPSEPAATEPAPTGPAPTEPAPTEPAPIEPAPTEPAPSAPGKSGTAPGTQDTRPGAAARH